MISEFSGEYRFLSNFYPAPVMFDGIMYENNEAAFQSAKLIDLNARRRFCHLDPSSAKREGRRVALRPDWEHVKDSIMEAIVRDKFTRNLDLKERLLSTGNRILVEGNWWGDRYWGMCNGEGLNKLGIIIMKVRDEIRLVDGRNNADVR